MLAVRFRGFRLASHVRISCALAVSLAGVLNAEAAPGAEIAWYKSPQIAARESASRKKPLLVMISARWCGPCHKMLQQTFPQPALANRINSQFIPLLVDADEQPGLIQKLNVEATPTVLVMDANQKVISRMTGFQSAAQLDSRLAAFKPVASRPTPRPIPHPPIEPPDASPQPAKSPGTLKRAKQFSVRDTLSAAKLFSAGR